MGVRKIFECEADGISIIIWEGGSGTRIVFPTETMAENASMHLIGRANQFHSARETNNGTEDEGMVSVILYGDVPMSEFQFVRDYIVRMRRLGFEIQSGMVRRSSEFW